MRGRKPLPPEIKALRAGDFSPALCVSPPPPCPEWLDEDAKALWDRLSEEMAALGLLSALTADTFAAYCQCVSQWKAACLLVRTEGMTVRTGKGMHRVHPAAQYAAEMARQVRAYAAEFGLTPASRSRAHTPAASPESDEMDDFLRAV